ncbi:hypothetical protein [Rhizobium rhizogenes]|uniref:hypothetical protein n=1 Tax=Rhizobium rhizogenes TaxID=359 RepID=UPI001571F7C3|nr:hypothetical protein [Rhizobium rhizogenes]NTF64929.1 hypothetical protein [Rhizobium rhizogenes]NTG96277.1 hypothetical protein [Rhizobium rhizogenes]
MRDFVNATFGSVELDIISQALEEWRDTTGISRDAPEYELAAAAIVTLFREGNRTLPELRAAISAHQWLSRDAVELERTSPFRKQSFIGRRAPPQPIN